MYSGYKRTEHNSKKFKEKQMNNRNQDLFFEHENDETAIVTLTDTEGNSFEVQVMASMEIEDEEKEYIAVLPVEGTDQFPEDQLIILIYSEDEDGNPQYAGITDENELAEIAEAFLEYFASEAE